MHEKCRLACRKSRGPLIGAKPGRFYVRVTAEGVKMDVKFMCALLGEKVRVAAQEEPRELPGHEAGCTALCPCPKDVCPAGVRMFCDVK